MGRAAGALPRRGHTAVTTRELGGVVVIALLTLFVAILWVRIKQLEHECIYFEPPTSVLS